MLQDPRQITELYGVCNNYAIFAIGDEKDRRYGIIDRNGEIVAEPEFIEFSLQLGRYVQCCCTTGLSHNPSYRLYDMTMDGWVSIDSNKRPMPIPGHTGLFYTYIQHNRCGIQDYNGNQIIPEIYATIFRIGEYFMVQDPKTEKYGILTAEGKMVIPCILAFDRVSYSAGKVLVRQADKWFYVNNCGAQMFDWHEIVLPDDVLGVNLYSDRICYYIPCWKKLRGLDYRACGMLDTSGTELLPPIYFVIHGLNEKYFSVGDAETFFCGLTDSDGNTIIPADSGVYVWTPIKEDENMFIFQTEGSSNLNSGIVRIGPNKEIQEVLPARFVYPHWLPDSEAQGHGCIVLAQSICRHQEKILRAGVFSLTGEQLVPFEYDDILLGNDPERIAVCKGGEWFFINLKNKRTLF